MIPKDESADSANFPRRISSAYCVQIEINYFRALSQSKKPPRDEA